MRSLCSAIYISEHVGARSRTIYHSRGQATGSPSRIRYHLKLRSTSYYEHAYDAMKERWSHGRGCSAGAHINSPLRQVDSETPQRFGQMTLRSGRLPTPARPHFAKGVRVVLPVGLFSSFALRNPLLSFFHASICETSPFMKGTLRRKSMHFPSPIEAAHVPVSL